LKNIDVPKKILELEQKIEDIKVEKNKSCKKSTSLKKAASLRDSEKKLQEELEIAKK
jgi:ATP-dependent Clp protease ATP-binding subunit ClpC